MALSSDEKGLLFWQRYHAELCMEWARTNHRLTTRRLGLKYDPNQPRVGRGNPAGGQWLGQNVGRSATPVYRSGYAAPMPPKSTATPTDQINEPSFQNFNRDAPITLAQFADPQALPPPAGPDQRAIVVSPMAQSAIDLFNYLTAKPKTGGPVVLELAPREYIPSASDPFELAFVRSLSRSEVRNYCPSIETVQEIADSVSKSVRANADGMSPQQIGTAIHYDIAKYIRAHPELGLEAEVTFNVEGSDRPGAKGSVRADANEETAARSLCIYDFKTGNEPLSPARATQLTYSAFRTRGKLYNRYYITEIRPQR